MAVDPSNASRDAPGDVTRLLRRASAGDALAERELYGRVYEELHQLARMHMSRQNPAATLQPTALVNEAWLRLAKFLPKSGSNHDDRTHFLRVASSAMRSTLVDAARKRASKKRGGDFSRVPLELAADLMQRDGTDLIALDEALERLGNDEPRQAKIVELRFFGGLTLTEVAEAVGISLATVQRDWSLARIWLREELRPELN